MKHEAENIDKLLGFGNDRIGSDGEHYQSTNFEVGRSGMAMGQKISEPEFRETYYDNNLIEPDEIATFAAGEGGPYLSNESEFGYFSSDLMVYALDIRGRIWFSPKGTKTWRLHVDLENLFNDFIFGSATRRNTSLTVDPKGRVMALAYNQLFADNDAGDEIQFSINVTNGSNKITKHSSANYGFNTNNGGDDPAYFEGELVIINDGDKDYVYKVTNQTDSELTISAPYQGSTQTDIQILTTLGWEENVGGGIAGEMSKQNIAPTANYEDTVLFGLDHRVATYNINSDTTADTALGFPDGFEIRNLLVGSTGILIVANFNGKGVLALWDNSAQRSIAPWINLDERIVGSTELDGKFVIRTIRSLYISDGYSLSLDKTDFLDQDYFPEQTEWRSNIDSTNDGFYMGLDSDGYHGKAKSGIYHYRSSTDLFTHIRPDHGDMKNIEVTSIMSDPSSGRVFFAIKKNDNQNKIVYLDRNTSPKYATYVSQEMIGGANNKFASGVYLDLGVADPAYRDNPISFTVTCKVADVERQMQSASEVKTTQTAANQIVVDEVANPEAKVGDEVVFVEGDNASQTRNIDEIADGGTDTAVYTLDRDLPNMAAAGDEITITPFRLLGVNTYTDEDEIPQVYFNVGNDIRGRRFMVKFEIIDSEIPLELRPSYFIYENDTIA